MAAPSSPTQAGPDTIPPRLPEGWLAQWDGTSRKYYYVQRATGVSQWDIPTKPALSAPTPEPTPQGVDPFGKPIDTQPAPDAEYAGQDRSLLGDLAMGALGGKQNQGKQSSGLVGNLAQSFLGGSKPSGGHSSGGIGGQLLNSVLHSGKPQNQSASSHQSGQGQQSGQQGSHLNVGGLFHHNPQPSNSNYGYNAGTGTGQYQGQAPPATYSPSGQASSYGPSTGPYHPIGSANYGSGAQSQIQTPVPGQQPGSYQSQTTPQPYNNTQPPPNQHFQNQQHQQQNQYAGSSSTTPAYGSQPSAPFGQQQTPSAGFNQQYGGPQQQQQAQNYPPPPGQAQGQGHAPNYPPPPSGQPPPYYAQHQQPSHQGGSTPNFPPSGGQYGQQNLPPPPNFPPPPGNQGYGGSPAPPPMHSHPSSQGYPSGPPSGGQTPNYGHGPQQGGYNGQGNDQYASNNYNAPAAPGWR